ncbi:hypothetical protein KIN20_009883 [Parelaphostrongylus tenuis]|uniref:Uncharacterized protein n=1 Tax=Parelaphostrongylus tenuis TaxID=148309 RepID=A0AAD5MT59_PARTN|nr:hypothetical protein KIN20_009883 [Parelaphostrongylus tenuis]
MIRYYQLFDDIVVNICIFMHVGFSLIKAVHPQIKNCSFRFFVVINSAMIHLQVHLQIPCYDFYPVQAIAIELFPAISRPEGLNTVVRSPLETAQSRTATGGVYKWQGRNQRELMTHTY